jgi:hydroxyisourate hydrolase
VIERLSTHVLDTAAGAPAAGVDAHLEDVATGAVLGHGTTDDDGRVGRLNDELLAPGDYRIVLDLAAHQQRRHHTVFHPTITVHVRLDGARTHYHVPVLVGPYSYTTYLGS